MASTCKCPYCGSVVRSDQESCPACGAPNELYVADSPRRITQPKTIEELREYCAERNMPLLRMRFFIGENFTEPRAFGIYRDGKDVVVYKNKSDGTRAVRYRGPDEARAVDELFQKLLEECHRRGIYPDGRPASQPVQSKPSNNPYAKRSHSSSQSGGSGRSGCAFDLSGLLLRPWLLLAIIVVLALAAKGCTHIGDGYYRVPGDDKVYYNYGTDWYYSYDGGESDYWYKTENPPSGYSNYSLGDDWNDSWGVSDFKDSGAWERANSSSSSSSSSGYSSSWDDDDDWDWDSWDSGDTDWDSDW